MGSPRRLRFPGQDVVVKGLRFGPTVRLTVDYDVVGTAIFEPLTFAFDRSASPGSLYSEANRDLRLRHADEREHRLPRRWPSRNSVGLFVGHAPAEPKFPSDVVAGRPD